MKGGVTMNKQEKYNLFSKNLTFLMKRNDVTQKKLGELTGTSKQAIWNYCHGRNIPITSIMTKIATIFDIPSERFFYDDFEELDRNKLLYSAEQEINPNYLKKGTSEYPFVQQGVSAGTPLVIEGVTDLPTISVPDELLGIYARNSKILFMRVNGESMNNVIPNGSNVAVYIDFPLRNLTNGDIVVFEHNGEYSMKRYFDADNVIIFKPDSNDITFTDIVIKKTPELKIIGKVVIYSVFS